MIKKLISGTLLTSIISIIGYCTIHYISVPTIISDHDITITSHRGYSGKFPENTTISVEKALLLGVERIEIDVQQTKDGVVVLMHDTSIDRTTNGEGYIKNYTYKELQKFSIDSIYLIPTLQEILTTVKAQSTLVIEIKEGYNYYPNIEKNILALIEEFNAQDWCIIHSFRDLVLEKVHQLNPNITLHKLLLVPFFYDFKKMGYIQEFSVYYRFASPRIIRKIHQLDKKINVWTVNDKSKMQTLIKRGVDGIITDFPKQLQP